MVVGPDDRGTVLVVFISNTIMIDDAFYVWRRLEPSARSSDYAHQPDTDLAGCELPVK